MKRKIVLILVMIYVGMASLFSQSFHLPPEHPIYLNDSIDNSYFEFSGIAKWRSYVLLIPQHRSTFDKYHIVCIDTASIDSVISGKTLFALKTRKLIFSQSLDTLYNAIKKAILPRTDFGGIEGGIVVNNDIFFTVETDSLCYVVKGTIDGETMQVQFHPNDTMSLPKPDYTFGNAGYESIAYLPAKKKLIAAYENNAITAAPTAFTFTTNLTNKEAVPFTTPLLFRLTDMANEKGNTLIGLNHYYRDYIDTLPCGVIPKGANTLKNEYCYYIGKQLPQAIKEMGANPQQASFTRIVQIVFRNGKLYWKKQQTISYSADNWEGILPYKKGVLMVVDGRPPGVACKLSYFALP